MNNLWAIARALLIFSQLALILTGTVTFVIRSSAENDDHFPSHSEWERDVLVHSTLPWVSSTIGAVGILVNVILMVALWRVKRVRNTNPTAVSQQLHRRTVTGSIFFTSLFAGGDIALAAVNGRVGLIAISIVASFAAVAGVLTVIVDIRTLQDVAAIPEDDFHFINSHGENRERLEMIPPSYEEATVHKL